jgi:hypothetical protein
MYNIFYFLNRLDSCLIYVEFFSSFRREDEDEDEDEGAGNSTPGAQPSSFNVLIRSSSFSCSFGGL